MSRPNPASDDAVTAGAFAAAMAQFKLPVGARVAVAVSGGADSMALVRLLADWAFQRNIAVHGLTVDHHLRDAATEEAARVSAWLGQQDIAHTTLRWDGGQHARTLARSVQSEAREARYRLMAAWCAANDTSHIFVAHHADDQVETFLLRLSRGSGVDGLAAMAPASRRDGITIARPLLGFTKDQLVAACNAFGQDWIEDPSNQSAASARVRFRQARQLLEREGLSRERLLATVGHLQRARAALDHAVASVLARGQSDAYGVARLPLIEILAAPEEIALRALARVLAATGGQDFGPRFESLVRLHARLTAGPWSDATLHGCLITRNGNDIVICREPSAITDEKGLTANTSVLWDRRFRITLAAEGVLNLNAKRLDRTRDVPEFARATLGEIPANVRLTLPALYDSQGLAALPHIAYVRADVAAMPGFSLGMTKISGGFDADPPYGAKL